MEYKNINSTKINYYILIILICLFYAFKLIYIETKKISIIKNYFISFILLSKCRNIRQ